ncbi:MAG: hypothetical protein V4487_05615, partial [Chlamydiota bacterium]
MTQAVQIYPHNTQHSSKSLNANNALPGWRKIAAKIHALVIAVGECLKQLVHALARVVIFLKNKISSSHPVSEGSHSLSQQAIVPPSIPAQIIPQAPLVPQSEISRYKDETQRILAQIEFPPYTLIVEFPAGPKPYRIESKQEEVRVVQELETWVNANFQPLRINEGIWSEDLCQRIGGQYARIRKVFTDHFALVKQESDGYESLQSKVIAQETLGDDLIRIRYGNGIVEKRRLIYGKWQIESRSYPSGDVERGRFWQGKLISGYTLSKGKYTFLYPQEFFNRAILLEGREHNFTEVEMDGKLQLALIEKEEQSYQLSEKSPLLILFAGAKDDVHSSTIKQLLQSPLNLISAQAIVEYVFDSDETGEARIFSLGSSDVLEILTQAQLLKIPFDLHAPSPRTGQPLFAKWAGESRAELIKCMLEMDPTCIDQTLKEKNSFFRRALDNGSERGAKILEEAMKARGIPLSNEDLWMQKIYSGDSSFAGSDFQALPLSFQRELYRAAHTFDHEDLVFRMNALGMKQKSRPPSGPTPLSFNMDLVDQKEALRVYLAELRQNKQLLLSEEAPQNLASFHCNEADFSRIPGADFVKKTV